MNQIEFRLELRPFRYMGELPVLEESLYKRERKERTVNKGTEKAKGENKRSKDKMGWERLPFNFCTEFIPLEGIAWYARLVDLKCRLQCGATKIAPFIFATTLSNKNNKGAVFIVLLCSCRLYKAQFL